MTETVKLVWRTSLSPTGVQTAWMTEFSCLGVSKAQIAVTVMQVNNKDLKLLITYLPPRD